MEELIVQYFNNLHTVVLLVIIAFFLYLLGKGADLVVEEAVKMSLAWGVPKLIIGSTIVSLGTTLPETSVSVVAAIQGNSGLALGNAVGSIIADTALILGLAIIIGLVPAGSLQIRKQSSIQVASVLLLTLACLVYLPSSEGARVAQWMGFVLVALLILYIVYSIRSNKNAMELGDDAEQPQQGGLIKTFFALALGIILIIVSSKSLIPAVQIVATRVGIPEAIIGATLVAFGTSLPELITSLTAVRKNHGDLAIGNVIGADILNVLFVTGVSAAVTPAGLEVPKTFFMVQIPFMLLSVFFLKLAIVKTEENFSKGVGYTLLLMYMGYLGLTFLAK